MDGLVFRTSSDGKTLQAFFSPADCSTPADDASIKKALQSAGFGDFYLFTNACAELANRCHAATEPFSFDLGERRDGTFTLTVTPDLMTAKVTITPPYGGMAVTPEQIYQALEEQQISCGIQHEVIAAVTTACRALNKPIALGQPPQPGENAQLISLVPEMKERCPHPEDDDSVVDYRELGGIISVKLGDPLMRRVPPTDGEPGTNIKGEILPGIPGKDITFAPTLPGSATCPDDPDLLVAAVAGQPVLVANGVMVEPTVKVKCIDLSTGNISIDGSLVVTGDIASGMIVKASGDIIVGGTVEAAMLEAGGNIEIKGGAIFAHVHAKGSITALFAEKSHLHAAGNVFLQELAMQSELKSGGQIVVGAEGTKKGHVIGGLCRAVTLVLARIVGSHAGVPTRIEVGMDPDAREKLAAVKQQLEQKQAEADELHKAIAYMYDNVDRIGKDVIKLKEKAQADLEAEMAELAHQKKRLQKRLETIGNATIEVKGTIYYGVNVVIGEKMLTIDEDLEDVVFRLEEQRIVH